MTETRELMEDDQDGNQGENQGENQDEDPTEGCSEAGGSSVDPDKSTHEPPPPKKSSKAEEKRGPEELKSRLSPECLKYAEQWIKEKNLDPDEIWQFVQIIYFDAKQRENKHGDKSPETRKHPEPKDKATRWSFPWSATPVTPTVTLSSVVTGQTFGAHKSIIDHLKIKQLQVNDINSHKQHKSRGIIIFCPITSRAGSDVETAMRYPAVSSSDKPLILVLLYHTRDPDYCTAGRKCSEKFPRVQAEVHFLFHETQMGLIRSDQNNQATHELREAICNTFDLS